MCSAKRIGLLVVFQVFSSLALFFTFLDLKLFTQYEFVCLVVFSLFFVSDLYLSVLTQFVFSINQIGCNAQWFWNAGQHCSTGMVCWGIGQDLKRGLHLKVSRHRLQDFCGAWEAICSQGRQRLWLMLASGRKGSVSNQGNSSPWLIPSDTTPTLNLKKPSWFKATLESWGTAQTSYLRKRYMLGKRRKKREWMQARGLILA